MDCLTNEALFNLCKAGGAIKKRKTLNHIYEAPAERAILTKRMHYLIELYMHRFLSPGGANGLRFTRDYRRIAKLDSLQVYKISSLSGDVVFEKRSLLLKLRKQI